MSATKEPSYACPHIDAVLESLKELFADLPSGYEKWRIGDIEAVYDGLRSLEMVTENSLERVRSICEELRAQRREYEEQVEELQEKADRLTDEKQDLEDRVQELEFQLESLQGE